MTEQFDSDLRPPPEDKACAYSLPVQFRGKPLALAAPGGDAEGVYDVIRSEEDNITDDATYSKLNHDNTEVGGATCKGQVLSVSVVPDQEMDSMYHRLGSEEHNMYSTIR